MHSYLICIYTTQKKLRVKGNVLIIFVSMSSLVWTSFWGVHVNDFFHQGNKLVSNQKFLFVFSVREPSNNYVVISRHHFSSLAYIYMHKYCWPLTCSIHCKYPTCWVTGVSVNGHSKIIIAVGNAFIFLLYIRQTNYKYKCWKGWYMINTMFLILSK